jgi:hypothetical protein
VVISLMYLSPRASAVLRILTVAWSRSPTLVAGKPFTWWQGQPGDLAALSVDGDHRFGTLVDGNRLDQRHDAGIAQAARASGGEGHRRRARADRSAHDAVGHDPLASAIWLTNRCGLRMSPAA